MYKIDNSELPPLYLSDPHFDRNLRNLCAYEGSACQEKVVSPDSFNLS